MDELTLYETKWFDYRLLSPAVATVTFINDWNKAMTRHNDRIGKGAHVYLLKNCDLSSIEAVQYYREWPAHEFLRQWCDRRRIQYPVFWAEYFDQAIKSGFKKVGPNAAASESARFQIQLVAKEIEKRRAAGLIETSEWPFFKAENYCGNRLQNDYYDYLFCACRNKYGGQGNAAVQDAVTRLLKSGLIARDYFANQRWRGVSKCLVTELLAA